MATLLFCDSYSHYDTAGLAAKYSGGLPAATVPVSIAAGAGRLAGAGCYRVPVQTPQAAVTLYQHLPGGGDIRCIEAHVRITGAPGPVDVLRKNGIFILHETGGPVTPGAEASRVQWTDTGNLMVTGAAGDILGTTSGLGLMPGVWYHIGLRIRYHISGDLLLRVNGVTVLETAGFTAYNPFAGGVSLGNVWAAQTDFADLKVTSDDLYGPSYVAVLFPNGAGAYSQWTPAGAASGVECVDDPVMNGDTDYVASAAAGQRSSYTVTPLVLPGTLLAVQHVAAMRKDDAGVRTSRQFVRIAGVDYDNVRFGSPAIDTLTESYVMYRQPLSANPAGGAWTPAALNAAEPGVLVVS